MWSVITDFSTPSHSLAIAAFSHTLAMHLLTQNSLAGSGLHAGSSHSPVGLYWDLYNPYELRQKSRALPTPWVSSVLDSWVLPWRLDTSPQDICGTVEDEGMETRIPRPGSTVLSMYTGV